MVVEGARHSLDSRKTCAFAPPGIDGLHLAPALLQMELPQVVWQGDELEVEGR